jgi:hypothetical protein
MAYWTSVQDKIITHSIISLSQNPICIADFPRKGWNWVYRPLASQSGHTPRQCPRAIIILSIHCRPANLTRIYHSNLFQWYCSTRGRDPAIASQKLQTNLLAVQKWFKEWRIKANGSKSTHITFTTRRETCPPNHINNEQLPPEKNMSSISGCTLKTYLALTHFRKMETTGNHPHQNVLVTRTQVKTLYKQQSSQI